MSGQRKFASFKGGHTDVYQEFMRFGNAAKKEFADIVEEASELGYDKTAEVAKTRHDTWLMSNSVMMKVERTESQIKVGWGWLNDEPFYTKFQEYGTYHRHRPADTVLDDPTLGVSGRAIAPMQALLRGFLVAEDHYRKRANG